MKSPVSGNGRRDFIATTLAAVGATAFHPDVSWAQRARKTILILGGTGFVGPHQVRRALERGHRVTIFNRGRSAPGMFGKDVEELAGDRVGGKASVVWVGTEFLRNIGPGLPGFSIFREMQVLTAGYSRFDVTPEIKAGLTFRPTEVTARETLAWFRTLPADRQAGILSAEREAKLLAAWKARVARGV